MHHSPKEVKLYYTMIMKKNTPFKLEDLQREWMYRDYLARLKQDKKDNRRFSQISQKTKELSVPGKVTV